MNVLFLRHVAHESGGRLERAALARGWSCATVHPDDPGALARASASDLLVVLGGPMGVYEAGEVPFLRAELDVLQKRLAAKRPVVGVCLGAQLIAAAAGGRVYKGSAGFEVGFGELSRAAGAEGHPWGMALPERFPVLHWHGDTLDLPPGATLLASSPRYANQVFALGGHALGLQCHIETAAAELESFVTGNSADLSREPAQPADRILREGAAHDTEIDRVFTVLFEAFVKSAGLAAR